MNMERRSDQIIRNLRQLAENRDLSPGAVTVSAKMADFIQDLLREAADMLEELREMAERKPENPRKSCGTCWFSHWREDGTLQCWGEREAPTVRPEHLCDGWQPMDEPEERTPKPVTSIEEWVAQGIRIAQEKGKSAEELCAMIRSGWAIAALFDAARRV